jgi:two-component system OmpR family response regulator
MKPLCGNALDGLQRAIEAGWSVIILDRMLPNQVDGLSILSTLRSLGKTTPVLVLSALSAVDERVRGLKAGGDDYLTKPFAFSELIARAESLIRRSQADQTTSSLIELADLSIDLTRRRASRSGVDLQLQPREFRLLTHLALNKHHVVTRTMLLEAVWDYRFDPQSNMIDVQVSRLRRKLDADYTVKLLHTVRGSGYVLSDAPQQYIDTPFFS